MLGDRAVTGIAIAVTAVWVALNLWDAVSTMYDTPVMVHTIMGLVAGSAFGERIRRSKAPRKTLEQLGLLDDKEEADRDDR